MSGQQKYDGPCERIIRPLPDGRVLLVLQTPAYYVGVRLTPDEAVEFAASIVAAVERAQGRGSSDLVRLLES